MLVIIGDKYQFNKDELLQLDSIYLEVMTLDSNYDDTQIKKFLELNKLRIKQIVLNLPGVENKELKLYSLESISIPIDTIEHFLFETFQKSKIIFNKDVYFRIKSIKYSTIGFIGKVIFDKIFSLIVLLGVSPIMIFIAYRIKKYSPEGDIFFIQERLGLNGKKFRVLKFRTMIPDAEKVLEEILANDILIREEYMRYRKLKIDPRVIPGIGTFLRRTSLDELPQFLNVLMGDMSVVGPRPYIEDEFINHEDKFKEIILSVKSGVTGYWQVGGRSESTFNERVESDIVYIINRTFWLDIKIVWKTVLMMLKKDNGAY